MNKVVIAITVLSFGLIAWFLCGSQAPAFAQSSPALERSLLVRPDAIPEIPEINSHFSRTHAAGGSQQLDGMDISNSEFKDITWEYSGGAVSLNDVTIFDSDAGALLRSRGQYMGNAVLNATNKCNRQIRRTDFDLTCI